MTTLRKVTCKTCGKVANWADDYGPAFSPALCACAKAGVPALQWTSTPPSEPAELVLVRPPAEHGSIRAMGVAPIAAYQGALCLCFRNHGSVWSPIVDMPEGTEYCPIPDIAEEPKG